MFLTMLKNDTADLCRQMVPEKFLLKDQLIGVICLDDEQDVAGAAVVEPDEDSLTLQWIYVLPESRNTGAGTLMLKGLKEMAKAMGARDIEVYFEDEELVDFFTVNGFLVLEDAPVYSFRLGDISLSALAGKGRKCTGECVSLEEMKKNRKGDLIKRFRDEGIPDYLNYTNEQLSFCYTDEKGKTQGCILCSLDHKAEELRVVLLLNFTSDPRITIKLIEAALIEAMVDCSGKYKVTFIAKNPAAIGLAKKLLEFGTGLSEESPVLRGVYPVGIGN